MAVIVTYDENGGFWDHVPPPTRDRWGPGTRVPALVVSPFARKGFVDSTQHDTTSILKLIETRFGLAPLTDVEARATALTDPERRARRPGRRWQRRQPVGATLTLSSGPGSAGRSRNGMPGAIRYRLER